MSNTRTRFAPSPTGFMHIGNLRTAIFEYLVAKHNNGKFILRIEDTDQVRKVEGATKFIYDTLKLCDIKIDEGPENPGDVGPYVQSDRKDIYKEYALKLVELGEAYYCFCTEDRLDTLRKMYDEKKQAFKYDRNCLNLSKEEIENNLKNNVPYVIRQKMPTSGISSFNDVVYGEIKVSNDILEDQILLKSDGFPTYNFANVIDDHLMGITHVIRGNEYLSQTPKYNLLYKAFGWEAPTYIHVPMVLGEDGNKLSKRNGDASFMDLYNDGYLPEAIVNYLVLLGWSPKDNKEIFTMEELIKDFDPARISKSPSIYDVKKLGWVNSHYIKKLSDEELFNITFPHLKRYYDVSNKDNTWIMTLINLYKDELRYGKEIVELAKMFFEEEYCLDEECIEFMKQEGTDEVISSFKKEIELIGDWSIDNIAQAINNVKEKTGFKGKILYMPIRIKTTGFMHGPELAKTIYLFGYEKIINRLGK